ncbi:hypothetical protein HPG69_010337 [Diceros bicornis minor]|uniref:Protein CMSS1 n=1 Tax=Diceros bicornis minor TaxID=77932 RepID=A0A7J7F7P8_DICBM|nr:hypothetical protein HPG69_010337 [Diceros bicornis minor]
MAWSTGLYSQDPEDSDQGKEEFSAELADQGLLLQNPGIQRFGLRAPFGFAGVACPTPCPPPYRPNTRMEHDSSALKRIEAEKKMENRNPNDPFLSEASYVFKADSSQPKECFLIQPKERKEDATKTRKRKKKKITDVLAKSEPKPGTPQDLQKLMKDYYSSSRSVIELEELNLPDSCFLKANDLTHSLSSYLKEICPKWVKLWKNHGEKKSVLLLIICSSAVRALELIRSMTAFRGDSKVVKLFAKHIKVQEQVKLLEKRVVHLGVGTPGRIKELIKQGGLDLNPLKFLVFDWNWRDQKLRRMMDIPEIRKEVFELLEMGILSLCKSKSLKLGLF